MNLRKTMAAFAAAILIASGARVLYAAPDPDPSSATGARADRESDLYDKATDAIDDARWDDAVRGFTRVAEMKGSRADGAIFWSAYALNKLGRKAEALKAVDTLKKAYPSSRWIDDAKALELELRQARGERVAPERVDDQDLKIIAINSLMSSDPEKAYPLLEKIVRGPSDGKIKDRALFILSQSESPRAQALLGDIARGKSNPDLQKQAVRYLGMSGNAQNSQVLAELYASGATTEVKKEVLQAYMLSDDKARVVSAARAEKDPGLRSEAIRLLGVMNARTELASLYANESSADVREDIIQGLFISNDGDKLAELARGEKNPTLRREAIQKLGLMGSKTASLLRSMYASESDEEVKKAIINAFFLQDNARALIELSKTERNQRLRREAVQKLSLMDDDEALAYMLEVLDE